MERDRKLLPCRLCWPEADGGRSANRHEVKDPWLLPGALAAGKIQGSFALRMTASQDVTGTINDDPGSRTALGLLGSDHDTLALQRNRRFDHVRVSADDGHTIRLG